MDGGKLGAKGQTDIGAPTHPGDLQFTYADATPNQVVTDPSWPGLVTNTDRIGATLHGTPADIYIAPPLLLVAKL